MLDRIFSIIFLIYDVIIYVIWYLNCNLVCWYEVDFVIVD